MEGSQEAYAELLGAIEEAFPAVATQVRDAVSRGIPVSALQDDQAGLDDSQANLKQLGLGRITKTDIAVRPYSADEQLLVLIGALRTLALSMAASRRAARGLLDDRAIEGASIGFADPVNENRTVAIDRRTLTEEMVLLDEVVNDITATISEV